MVIHRIDQLFVIDLHVADGNIFKNVYIFKYAEIVI